MLRLAFSLPRESQLRLCVVSLLSSSAMPIGSPPRLSFSMLLPVHVSPCPALAQPFLSSRIHCFALRDPASHVAASPFLFHACPNSAPLFLRTSGHLTAPPCHHLSSNNKAFPARLHALLFLFLTSPDHAFPMLRCSNQRYAFSPRCFAQPLLATPLLPDARLINALPSQRQSVQCYSRANGTNQCTSCANRSDQCTSCANRSKQCVSSACLRNSVSYRRFAFRFLLASSPISAELSRRTSQRVFAFPYHRQSSLCLSVSSRIAACPFICFSSQFRTALFRCVVCPLCPFPRRCVPYPLFSIAARVVANLFRCNACRILAIPQRFDSFLSCS